jgi:hypothetical protein
MWTDLESRTLETAMDDARLPPHTFDGIMKFTMKMRQVNTTDVAQLHAFELLPDTLVGVQVRGLRWQALQVQPLRRAVGQELPDGVAAVDRRAIPYDHQPACHLPQQVFEKSHDIAGIERMVLAIEIQLALRICVCPTGA